MGDDDLNQIR